MLGGFGGVYGVDLNISESGDDICLDTGAEINSESGDDTGVLDGIDGMDGIDGDGALGDGSENTDRPENGDGADAGDPLDGAENTEKTEANGDGDLVDAMEYTDLVS
jgi:hypothetical protein